MKISYSYLKRRYLLFMLTGSLNQNKKMIVQVSNPVRIIVASSGCHFWGNLDIRNLNCERYYDVSKYCEFSCHKNMIFSYLKNYVNLWRFKIFSTIINFFSMKPNIGESYIRHKKIGKYLTRQRIFKKIEFPKKDACVYTS